MIVILRRRVLHAILGVVRQALLLYPVAQLQLIGHVLHVNRERKSLGSVIFKQASSLQEIFIYSGK